MVKKVGPYDKQVVEQFLSSRGPPPNWIDRGGNGLSAKLPDGGVVNFYPTTNGVLFQGKNAENARNQFLAYVGGTKAGKEVGEPLGAPPPPAGTASGLARSSGAGASTAAGGAAASSSTKRPAASSAEDVGPHPDDGRVVDFGNKHSGKTFAETYRDSSYVEWVLNLGDAISGSLAQFRRYCQRKRGIPTLDGGLTEAKRRKMEAASSSSSSGKAKSGNTATSVTLSAYDYYLCFDGSCPDNNPVDFASNPAGWGVAVFRPPTSATVFSPRQVGCCCPISSRR